MAPGHEPNEDAPHPPPELYSECELPTQHGVFQVRVYRDSDGREHLLLTYGDLQRSRAPFTRLHSECLTGEVLGSLKCDCREQLDIAMKTIAKEGHGVIVYLRQEGRGIGLGNKIRAYAEQDRGADTIEANTRLGFPIDARDYALAAEILRLNGIDSVRLHTNNPQKIADIKAAGITIEEVISSPARTNPHNADYIQTKQDHLGHTGLKNGTEP